jgi:hypothetical protein
MLEKHSGDCIYVQIHMVLQLRRRTPTASLPYEPQISMQISVLDRFYCNMKIVMEKYYIHFVKECVVFLLIPYETKSPMDVGDIALCKETMYVCRRRIY